MRSKFLLPLVFLLCVPATSQTLARRGWAGSGLSVESWWSGAVFYVVDPLTFQDTKGNGYGDLRGIIRRLDYLESLGVDGLVLSPFPLNIHNAQPLDAAYGTDEDLAQLVAEASRHKIRVLVDLPFTQSESSEELANKARFLLTRGIAGLRLVPGGPEQAGLNAAESLTRLNALLQLAAGFGGARAVFWDLPEKLPSGTGDQKASAHRRRNAKSVPSFKLSSPQLVIDPRLDRLDRMEPGALRTVLSHAPLLSPKSTPVSRSDSAERPRSFERLGQGANTDEYARLTAAALLLGPGATELLYGQEIGMASGPSPLTPMQWGREDPFTNGVPWVEESPNAASDNVGLEDRDPTSLLNWYRQLSTVRHADAAIRTGSIDLLSLADPSIVAWVRRTRSAGDVIAPVVVVCNFSSKPAVVSLGAELRRLGIQTDASKLHTLACTSLPNVPAASQNAAPGLLNAIALPPFGVYVGVLTAHAGLETEPAPARHHLRRTKSRKT